MHIGVGNEVKFYITMQSNHPQNKLPVTNMRHLQIPIKEKTFNPINTEQRIKKAFEYGDKLTVLDCFKRFGTFELKRYVYLLKKRGLQIVDEWKSNDRKRWKVYWLAR